MKVQRIELVSLHPQSPVIKIEETDLRNATQYTIGRLGNGVVAVFPFNRAPWELTNRVLIPGTHFGVSRFHLRLEVEEDYVWAKDISRFGTTYISDSSPDAPLGEMRLVPQQEPYEFRLGRSRLGREAPHILVRVS